MNWDKIDAGKLRTAENKFWDAVGDKADFVVRSINNDQGYLMRLAAYAVNPPFADKMYSSINPQWLRAREIMGNNFFGVEEAAEHFAAWLVGESISKLIEIPFSEAMLEKCKHTHVLVAVLPLSIVDIAKMKYEPR